jgi:hypothetical protein
MKRELHARLSGRDYFSAKVIIIIVLFLLAGVSGGLQAQGNHTFNTGSYIINMGVYANNRSVDINTQLKPYGMVYELLKTYNIPVYWVIGQGKVKDGTDFTYNGVVYRGGTFLIDKEFITPVVASRISYWNSQGVVGAYTTSSLTLPYQYKFTTVPTWTLDAQNGSIATGFFANAGIPVTAYNWLLPSQLGVCNDVFVMPHADPKWATHGNLYNWNQQYKGSIWLGCHAGSAFENMYNPANTSEQTNFLSEKVTSPGTGIILPVTGSTAYAQNSLVLWGNHSNASIPFITTNNSSSDSKPWGHLGPWLVSPSDPVAQFIGIPDLAHLNGSEQVFLPVKGGGYRQTTRVITYDPTQVDVPSISDGPALIIAYGRAFGDNNRGYAMYEVGHSINKGTVGDVPAQRAFFNWSLLTTIDKAPVISSITGIPTGGVFEAPAPPAVAKTYPMSVVFSSPVSSGFNTVTWSCIRQDNGLAFGTFTPNGTLNSENTVFTPTPTNVDVPCIITVKIVDQCGRTTFESVAVTIKPGPRPPIANPDAAVIVGLCVVPGQTVSLNVLANDTDPDGSLLTLTKVGGISTSPYVTVDGSWAFNANGDVVFTPAANFFGTTSVSYEVCDNTPVSEGGPLCATSTISVSLGTPDGNGCFPGTVYDVFNELGATTGSGTNVDNPTSAQGLPDFDETDASSIANTAATINVNNTEYLILNYGSLITGRDTISVYFGPATAVTTTVKAQYSLNGTSYSDLNLTVSGSNISSNVQYEISNAIYDFPSSGLQYIRISKTSGTDALIDAVILEDWDCVSAQLTANDDNVIAREDVPATWNLIANDGNPGNLPLNLSIAAQPTHGKLSINPDNTFTYINVVDYSGGDQFTYQICNSQGFCSQATVFITVIDDDCTTPGYYAPVAVGAPQVVTFSTTSQAEDTYVKQDAATTNYGTSDKIEMGKRPNKSRRMLWKPLNFTSIPSNAIIENATFRVTITGSESGTYTLNTSIYQMTQTWVENQATWNLRSTGNSWTGGSFAPSPYATLDLPKATNGTQYTFNVTSLVEYWHLNRNLSPRPDEMGLLIKQTNESTVDKRLNFGSSENTTASNQPLLTVTYLVPAPCEPIPNRPPLANPNFATTYSNQSVLVDVLANDYDVDVNAAWNVLSISNPSVSITSIDGHLGGSSGNYTGAQVGTALIESGQLRFTPNPAFFGTAVIRYQVSDNGSLTDETFLYVTVKNTPPNAVRDNVAISSNTSSLPSSSEIFYPVNDANPDGINPMTTTIIYGPNAGTAILSTTKIDYTPTLNYTGLDTIIYKSCEAIDPLACDPISLCDTAIVVITVNNRPPLQVRLQKRCFRARQPPLIF